MTRGDRRRRTYRDAGGTDGGGGLFIAGVVLTLLGVYFFLDSVRVVTGNQGLCSGMLRQTFGGTGQGFWSTTSMGVLFVPFFAGVATLFYDSKNKVGWALLVAGILVLIVEIMSQLRFYMNVKLSHFLLIIGTMAAGVGLILRSFVDMPDSEREAGA